MPQLEEVHDLQASLDVSWIFVEKSLVHQRGVGISATWADSSIHPQPPFAALSIIGQSLNVD
jgi:hypothetical protein